MYSLYPIPRVRLKVRSSKSTSRPYHRSRKLAVVKCAIVSQLFQPCEVTTTYVLPSPVSILSPGSPCSIASFHIRYVVVTHVRYTPLFFISLNRNGNVQFSARFPLRSLHRFITNSNACTLKSKSRFQKEIYSRRLVILRGCYYP